MVEAIMNEIRLRTDYLGGDTVETVYFGGGTPSILPSESLGSLLDEIRNTHLLASDAEITLEANPDDINRHQLDSWRELGINRLSIGIQTFDDDRLKFLNRVHSGKEAEESISLAREFGFQNLTCDLIYAIPPGGMNKWRQDIETLLSHDIPHISLYGLTIEPNTAFGKWHSSGKLIEVSESENAEQYEWAISRLKSAGFEHYEVSNFSQPGMHSRHNSSYWLQKPYLGLGPGAHSYDGHTRSFAISNNTHYMKAISNGNLPLEKETLSRVQRANEYILTRIRTHFGIDCSYVDRTAQIDFYDQNKTFIDDLIHGGLMQKDGNIYKLTSKGMLNADEIALKFFLDETVIS